MPETALPALPTFSTRKSLVAGEPPGKRTGEKVLLEPLGCGVTLIFGTGRPTLRITESLAEPVTLVQVNVQVTLNCPAHGPWVWLYEVERLVSGKSSLAEGGVDLRAHWQAVASVEFMVRINCSALVTASAEVLVGGSRKVLSVAVTVGGGGSALRTLMMTSSVLERPSLSVTLRVKV